MPRINVPRNGMSDKVTITSRGMFTFPRRVMERLGWRPPTRILVDHFKDKQLDNAPLILFLSIDSDPKGQGFALSFLNRTGPQSGSGGKISCNQFTRETIAPRISLPHTDVVPIYPINKFADLVLFLTEPSWQQIDFNMSGCQSINMNGTSLIGAYELLGADNIPLRIGEGNVQNRIREYLKEDRMVRDVKRVRYFPVSEKTDTVLMEQVLLARHETLYGKLPLYNLIRA